MAKIPLNKPVQESGTQEKTYDAETSTKVTSEQIVEDAIRTTLLIESQESCDTHKTIKVSQGTQTEAPEITPEGPVSKMAEESEMNDKDLQGSRDVTDQTSPGEETKGRKKQRRQKKRQKKTLKNRESEVVPEGKSESRSFPRQWLGVKFGTSGTLLTVGAILCLNLIFIPQTFAVEKVTDQWQAYSFVIDDSLEHLIIKKHLETLCNFPKISFEGPNICSDNKSEVYVINRTTVRLLTKQSKMSDTFFLEFGNMKSKPSKYEGSFSDAKSALENLTHREETQRLTTVTPSQCAQPANSTEKIAIIVPTAVIALLIGVALGSLVTWFYMKNKLKKQKANTDILLRDLHQNSNGSSTPI